MNVYVILLLDKIDFGTRNSFPRDTEEQDKANTNPRYVCMQ